MEPKVSYTLVGLFVIVFGATLVVIVMWLARGGQQKNYQNYYAYFRQSVSGLSQNAAVKYKGVSVGQVTDIRLDSQNPERVRVTLSIEEDAPIKRDTYATLSMQGLTGLAFIELSGGTRDAPSLTAQPGEYYPVIKTKPSLLMRLDDAVSTLLANLNQIAEAVADLSGEENRQSVKAIMVNMAELSGALRKREAELDQLLASAERTLKNTSEITERFPALVSQAGDTAAAIEKMARQISQTGQSLNAMVSGSQEDIRQFTGRTLSDVGALVEQLRELTAEVQGFVDHLKENPNSLLFGRQPPPRGPGE